jgi:hypothetical protein
MVAQCRRTLPPRCHFRDCGRCSRELRVGRHHTAAQPKTAREIAFVMDVLSNKMLGEYTAYDGAAIEGSLSNVEFAKTRR